MVTLARWLAQTVQDAYKRMRSLELLSSRAHEIRAWAASLAWAHSVSLSALLDAAYWRSQGTFMVFYLRDVSRLRSYSSMVLFLFVSGTTCFVVAAAGTSH